MLKFDIKNTSLDYFSLTRHWFCSQFVFCLSCIEMPEIGLSWEDIFLEIISLSIFSTFVKYL